MKKITRSSGFSLAEIMVAMGLMGVLAVGSMSIWKNQDQMIVESGISNDLNILHQKIWQNLNEEKACLNTLTPSFTGLSELVQIVDSNNNPIIKKDDTFASSTLGTGNKITLKKIAIAAGSPPKVIGAKKIGVSNLIFTYLNNKTSQVILKSIAVEYLLNSSNVVVKCNGAKENSFQTMFETSCEILGGIYDSDNEICNLKSFSSTNPSGLTTELASTKYIEDYINFLALDERYVAKSGNTSNPMTGELLVTPYIFNVEEICIGGVCKNTFSSICTAGSLLKGFNPDGSPVCKMIECPLGKYFRGIKSDDSLICDTIPNNSCPSGQYVSKVNADGSQVCTPYNSNSPITCNFGQHIQSVSYDIFGNASVQCAANQSGLNISCPTNQCVGSIIGTSASCNTFCNPSCPSPSTICIGSSYTGSDGCNGSCNVSGAMSENWSPSPSTVCSGESFTQTSNCGNSRTSTGTMSCSGGGSGGGGGCFVAGTLILMHDGSLKPIEEISVGDIVDSGNQKYAIVVGLKQYRSVGKKFSINGSSYFVTDNHPFKGKRGWLAINPKRAMSEHHDLVIDELKIKEEIYYKGDWITVKSIESTETDEYVYNFEVEGTHQYIANGFLVHNIPANHKN